MSLLVPLLYGSSSRLGRIMKDNGVISQPRDTGFVRRTERLQSGPSMIVRLPFWKFWPIKRWELSYTLDCKLGSLEA